MGFPKSPMQRKVLQKLYDTGLINDDQKEEYFPIRSYLACKGRKDAAAVPDHIIARMERLKRVAPQLSEQTIVTCLLAHDNIDFMVEAVQSLAHVSKEASENLRYALKGLHEEFKLTKALYSIPDKYVTKLEPAEIAEVRRRWVGDLARELVDPKTDMEPLYAQLDEMVSTGLFGVRKALDRAMSWCKRSGGFTNKLYSQTSSGGIRLAKLGMFLDMRASMESVPCKPVQSEMFKRAYKNAKKNRKMLAQIPKGARDPSVRVPPKPPKDPRPAYLKYTVKKRAETKLLSKDDMLKLMDITRLKDRQTLAKKKTHKTDTQKLALKALSSPGKTKAKKKSEKNVENDNNNQNNWGNSEEEVYNYNHDDEESKEKNYK